ncbi:hypothetical protein AOLI_G00101460 [Acnodon oligacanthus]
MGERLKSSCEGTHSYSDHSSQSGQRARVGAYQPYQTQHTLVLLVVSPLVYDPAIAPISLHISARVDPEAPSARVSRTLSSCRVLHALGLSTTTPSFVGPVCGPAKLRGVRVRKRELCRSPAREGWAPVLGTRRLNLLGQSREGGGTQPLETHKGS